MFRFEHTTYLFVLLAIPILVLFFGIAWRYRQQALARFGNPELVKRLVPGLNRYLHLIKFGLLLLAVVFVIVGWANPQWSGKRQTVEAKGIELFIALDISRSMLSNDISPSRMERAQRFAQNLVQELRGQKMGVVTFACSAVTSVPLTTDYAWVQLYLGEATPDYAGAQGTDIGAAIDRAVTSYSKENQSHKALVIISDGEDHNGAAIARATEANDNGLLIYTVGVGTEAGGFIPLVIGNREDYLRDKAGAPVRTVPDENYLREVAKSGGGSYFTLGNESQQLAQTIKAQIDTIENQTFEERSFIDYASYFQIFIGLAILLLLAEFLLPYRSLGKESE